MTDQSAESTPKGATWIRGLFWTALLVVLVLWISGVFSSDEPEPTESEPATAETTAQPTDQLSTEVEVEDPEPTVIEPKPAKQPKLEDKYYEEMETPPSMNGGMEALSKLLKYPAEAQKNGIEGAVTLKAYIDKEGNVDRTKIVKGIGYGCDEAAAEAVRKSRFVPGQMNAMAVKSIVTITVRFELDN